MKSLENVRAAIDADRKRCFSELAKIVDRDQKISLKQLLAIAEDNSGAILDFVNNARDICNSVPNGLEMIAPDNHPKDDFGEPFMPWDAELGLDYDRGTFTWSGNDGPGGYCRMKLTIYLNENDQFRVI